MIVNLLYIAELTVYVQENRRERWMVVSKIEMEVEVAVVVAVRGVGRMGEYEIEEM